MKKVLTILLAIGLVASFTACDNQETKNPNESGNNTVISGENNGTENNGTENNNPENNGTGNNDEQSGNLESGEEILPEEDDYMPSDELQTLVDTLITKSEVQFNMPGSMKIMLANAPTYVGLSEQLFTEYVEDSIVYEPMISPATSSLCIVKVSEDANVADLKQEVIDNCNPRKWVCTGAEKCLAIDSGNYILLIMSTPDNCEAMKTAFTEHFGAENVGEALTKDGVPAENYEDDFGGGLLVE